MLRYNFVLTSKHIEKKLYTDIDKYTHAGTIGQGSTRKYRRYRRRRPPSGVRPLPVTKGLLKYLSNTIERKEGGLIITGGEVQWHCCCWWDQSVAETS